MGGAEKLIFEIVNFAKQNNLAPTILILDNYSREYYDPIFEELGVEIIRTRLEALRACR